VLIELQVPSILTASAIVATQPATFTSFSDSAAALDLIEKILFSVRIWYLLRRLILFCCLSCRIVCQMYEFMRILHLPRLHHLSVGVARDTVAVVLFYDSPAFAGKNLTSILLGDIGSNLI